MSTEDDSRLGLVDHMAASPVTGQGFLTGPGLVEHPVAYAVVDGRAIHDGCIDMGPVEAVAAEAGEVAHRREIRLTTAYAGSMDGAVADPTDVVERGIGLGTDSGFLWTNGQVAYSIDAGVPNQGRVNDAIAHIQQNTGIRFTLRTSANAGSLPNWIQIVSNGNATFSSSAIGMRGGRQDLRLADGHPWPILVHEFLHALGVYHEQSRSDRDSFVEIKWDNIKDGPPPEGEDDTRHNFQTKPGSTDYFDYDYGSLMHYHRTAFAKDTSKPTIVPRREGVTIGQRNSMSFGDRQTVAKMYERFSEKGYSGVWRSGSGRYALWVNSGWDDFRTRWEQWSADGLRLVDVHVRPVRDGVRYSGVFLPGSGGHALWANATWDSFRAKWEEWSGQGLRLNDIHVVNVGGQDRFTGAFLPGNGGHALWVGATWDSFRAKWEELAGQGLRLVDFEFVNPAAGSLFDGADAADLPGADEIPEPFGGIMEAGVPAGAAAAAEDGYGGAELGERVPAEVGATAAGGAELPNVVSPRTSADNDRGGAGGQVDAESSAPAGSRGEGGMVRG